MQIARITTIFKALFQLGITQVGLNALYRFGLASGHYQRAIRPPEPISNLTLMAVMPTPNPEDVRLALGRDGLRNLLSEADEIVDGYFRQFGAEPIPIALDPGAPLAHWTAYESGRAKLPADADDIKIIWEPARFGWAFVLGRAYHISRDEKYPAAFWYLFETFNKTNPPYLGPNWTSGQEVGLRLMAWAWAGQVFKLSKHSNPGRMRALSNAIAVHAARIPATLIYARSQNNNHLLTEAAALFTSGLCLPTHPLSQAWQKTGRKWLAWCFLKQIDENGEYIQHSSNYQRLMLQTALWVQAMTGPAKKQAFPGGSAAHKKLALATGWVTSRLDPTSGQVPNLGANDGALITPLSASDFNDYRPVAQAGARAFMDNICDLPSGAWDEQSLWYGLTLTGEKIKENQRCSEGQIYSHNSWGSLRAVDYKSRPSHADQLHFDLWWRGLNIAQDAGTYRYNAAPPWDNRLTSTLVHNTISVDGLEQMTRAGKFLYLDWAPADFTVPPNPENASGQQKSAHTNAYARFLIQHERVVTVLQDEHWLVEDKLIHSNQRRIHTCRLHWLLPNWEWQLNRINTKINFRIHSPHGWISLIISASQPITRTGLIQGGNLIFGDGLVAPEFGWVSPTYNCKKPALSLAVEVQSANSFNFSSEFLFPS